MAADPIAFIHEIAPRDIPGEALHRAGLLLLDLIGVAAAGSTTANSRIVRAFAAACCGCGAGGPGARILLDGRRVSPPGAAMAGAATIDAFDAHDGHRLTKGHVGVVALPALLAFADEVDRGGAAEFMTRLVLGYEFGTRAGLALHATARDYHTSGAWNALAAAAIGARALGLDRERTRHALGAAEYYGPRSPMMRVIDHPTMLKDGATTGAFAGVSAALLAARGFTGAPAATVEGEAVAETWADLGRRWRIGEQYVKPYPICRWAQPAVEAALSARGRVADPAAIAAVAVVTFHEAARLAARAPATTEEAQYCTAFPVAAALARGRLGAAEIDGAGLRDPEVLRLSAATTLIEDGGYSALFPAERWARVELTLRDGETVRSAAYVDRDDPEAPPPEAGVAAKFEALAAPVLGADRTARLRAAVGRIGDRAGGVDDLLELLLCPGEAPP